MKRGIFLLTLFFIAMQVAAQEPVQTELSPVEVEIVRERKIVLPEANRLYEKIPPRPAEPVRPEITYHFRPLEFQTPLVNPSIRPFKIKDEQGPSVHQGFISAGYGNYASPYLEGFYNSARHKNQLVGAHLYHSSSGKGPVDGRNSASGSTGLSLFAESFGKAITYSANMGLHHRFTHFYGYQVPEVKRDTIRQAFMLFRAAAGITNSRKSNFNYSLKADFSYLDDKRSASESTVDLNFNSGYTFKNDSRLQFSAFYALMSRKDAGLDASPRHLLSVNPAYHFTPIDNLRLKAGAVIALENDTLDHRNFHLYPDIQGVYRLSPTVEVLAGINGGVERVSLQTITRENMWVGQRIALNNVNTLLNFETSLRARAGSLLTLQAGVSVAALRNFYGYLNDPVKVNEFQVVYDAGTTRRTNLFASLNLNRGDVFSMLLRGDLYRYQTDELAEAWHRPGYRTTLSASYSIQKKLRLEAELITLGDIRAFNPVTVQTVKLDPALDLNFRTEYLISPGFSLFLRFNNITNNKYSTLLYYPVRGLQVLGGLTWSF
jgi:hypothetical protein